MSAIELSQGIAYTGGVGVFHRVVGETVHMDCGDWTSHVNVDVGINLPHDTRPNVIFVDGYNLDMTGGPKIPGHGTIGVSVETHYVRGAGAVPVFEWHLFTHDTAGNPHRALSFMFPKDGQDGGASFQVDFLNFGNYAATNQSLQLDLKNKHMWLHGMDVIAGANNFQWARQRAADGETTLALPYLDEGDCLNLGGGKGYKVTGEMPRGGNYGGRFVVNACVGGIQAGDTLRAVYAHNAGQAIVGDVNLETANVRATGTVQQQLVNDDGAILEDRCAKDGRDSFAQYRSGHGNKKMKVGVQGDGVGVLQVGSDVLRIVNGTLTFNGRVL